MNKFKSVYTKIAYLAIREFLNNEKPQVSDYNTEIDDLSEKKACFVTLKSEKGDLRGCIGTIKPTHENLKDEIIKNAIAAATRDSRFKSLTLKELNKVNISVEILSKPEAIDSLNELDPKKYGLIISDGNYRRGVLLPDIEGIDTIEKQINIVKRKAGIFELENNALEFYRFTTEKHY